MKYLFVMTIVFFVSLSCFAEELTLPTFSDKVMSQGSDDYKPGCEYKVDSETGEKTSQCTVDGDGDVTNYSETVFIKNNTTNNGRLGRSDGISSDYANQKVRAHMSKAGDNK